MKNIIVFASGSGSNAQNIAEYFEKNGKASISYIFSNSSKAYVLERARNLDIPAVVFNRHLFYDSDFVLNFLRDKQPDLIVLAGFLWLVPDKILREFPNRIINIHPALLPKHGGRGMYGMKVHQAVVDNKETESGITIHYINENYDEGETIFQEKCEVLPTDTPDDVAEKVHALEYKNFPRILEQVLDKL